MADLIGRTLKNQYFIRRLAGAGGMAEVYQAWDQLRATNMAIKVLRCDTTQDARSFKMFTKEAEFLRKLEHPNIVRLYEFDKEDDIAFIVMDWIDGTDLKHAILERDRIFTLEETSDVLKAVCTALHYAHQRGVLHCDLKPGNILLNTDGRTLLTDFGVARLSHEKTGGGTPTYMAPEQFAGSPASSRTDIYSLGVTLYEIFSGGKLPFRGDSNIPGTTTRERIAWEHLNLPLPPLEAANPELPEEIILVIEKALNKEPQHRYGSVLELLDAFERNRENRGKNRAQLNPNEPKTAMGSDNQKKNQNIGYQKRKQSEERKPFFFQKAKTPRLLGRNAQWAGQVLSISDPIITIGRNKTCTLHLQEPSVSRLHASIILTKQGVYLRDESSSIGTYLNGQQIQPGNAVLLKDGDIIRIGSVLEFGFFNK